MNGHTDPSSLAPAQATASLRDNTGRGWLIAKNIKKSYNGRTVVDGASLAIGRGEAVGLLGPNGAGKTTMLRTLLGIIEPDEGSRSLLGSEDPLSQSRLVGDLPEERGLYQSMRIARFAA